MFDAFILPFNTVANPTNILMNSNLKRFTHIIFDVINIWTHPCMMSVCVVFAFSDDHEHGIKPKSHPLWLIVWLRSHFDYIKGTAFL